MKTIITFISVVFVFFLGLSLGRNNKQTIDTIVSTDTIIIFSADTVKETHYKTVERRITDTLHIHTSDTTFLVINREQQVVEGLKFKAWISGVRPKLDSIETYNDIETRYIEKVEYLSRKPKNWGIGFQAGAGVVINNGNIKLSPYIGVGISYNIIKF